MVRSSSATPWRLGRRPIPLSPAGTHGYIGSFNGTLRNECLNEHCFMDMARCPTDHRRITTRSAPQLTERPASAEFARNETVPTPPAPTSSEWPNLEKVSQHISIIHKLSLRRILKQRHVRHHMLYNPAHISQHNMYYATLYLPGIGPHALLHAGPNSVGLFLCYKGVFTHPAYRTNPRIRNIFKFCSGLYAAVGITNFRVIDVSTHGT